MGLTNAMKAKLLDHYYGGGNLARPETLYLGLSTTTPTATGGNVTEPVGSNYARVAIPNNSATWNNATVGNPSVKTNKVLIEFPRATGDWGTVTHWVLYEDQSGPPVDFAELEVSKPLTKGDMARFEPGSIEIRLSHEG